MRGEQLLADYFFNRTDIAANLAPWSRPCPVEVTDLKELLQAHIDPSRRYKVKHLAKGEPWHEVTRVGSYTPSPDGMVRWVCWDFDGKGHADALASPLDSAVDLLDRLASEGYPGHLERSGGGHGFHVWVFFDEPIPAASARSLAFSLTPGAKLESGKVADPRSNKGIEIFPKTDKAVGDRLGNMVWLPFWGRAERGNAALYEFKGDAWRTYVPELLQTASAGAWMRASEKIERPQERTQGRSQKVDPTTIREASRDWPQWRQDVLRAIDLRDVYGSYLTGKSTSTGWLECRDPWSESGDKDPSAGVADQCEAERGTFRSFRDDRKLTIFDFMVEDGQVRDLTGAFARAGELAGVPLPAKKPKAHASPVQPEKARFDFSALEDASILRSWEKYGGEKPRIVVNGRQGEDVSRDMWTALRKCRSPQIFSREGQLVTVDKVEGKLRARPVDTISKATAVLFRCAHWFKVTPSGDLSPCQRLPGHLAGEVVGSVVNGFPVLRTVSDSPVAVAPGVILAKPSFHEPSGTYVEPNFKPMPSPVSPSLEEVERARSLFLDDLLVDFMFAERADRANMLALLLSPFLRPMISGAAPVSIIEAPSAGSGKGLLVDLLSIIFTGSLTPVGTIPEDEDELRKRITAMLLLGRPIVSFDNMPQKAQDSANLAATLTAGVWVDRILGRTEMIEMKNRAIWVLNGNNPSVNVDLARRSMRIRIDTRSTRPWELTDFRHPDLRRWAHRNRPQLVHAALTMIQYWIDQGCPKGDVRIGSFEAYTEILSGLLDAVGVPGFLENRSAFYQDADEDTAEIMEFLEAWWQRHKTHVKASLLYQLAEEDDVLPSIRDRGQNSGRKRIGHKLRDLRDRVIGPYRVTRKRDHKTHSWMYKVEKSDGKNG